MNLPADQTEIRVHSCKSCHNLYAWKAGDAPYTCPRCEKPLSALPLATTIELLTEYSIFCTYCGRLSKHEHDSYPDCVLCSHRPRGLTADLQTS